MSREDWEVFDDIREERRQKRATNLAKADTAGWSQFTQYHFWRMVDGHRLDWWPSSNKWLYKGKYYRGGLPKAIKDRIPS